MERPVKGDIVVLPFPHSDLSAGKRRPALVLAELAGDDVILCQITSQSITDLYGIAIREEDYAEGKLAKPSNVRPNRVFTADSGILIYRAARLTPESTNRAIDVLVNILRTEEIER